MTTDEFSRLLNRYGYRASGLAADLGLARIVGDSSDELAVTTCDGPTADVLYRSDCGTILYRAASRGYLTLVFPPRQLGRVVQAIEGVARS